MVKCMYCEEKEAKTFEEWQGSPFFCCEEHRDEWNEAHPDVDTFRAKESEINAEKRFCPKCNHLMKEFWKDGEQVYECTYRKCDL